MKSLTFSLVLLFVLFIDLHCVKGSACSPNSPSSESATMQAFATANGINATAHSSGLYYEIITPGSGASASPNSIIFITYVGKLLDGTTFDEETNSANTGWKLSKLIEGWIVGIPLIQAGGHIKLIVPSAMAYGCVGYMGIPGNTIVYFDIHLVDVQ